jgi:hypothetical protein
MMARGNGRGICLVVVGRVPFCPTPKQGRCSSTSPPFHLSSVSLLAFTLASSALHLPAPPPLSLSRLTDDILALNFLNFSHQ